MAPIVATILTGIAISVGTRLATAVAKGLADTVSSRDQPPPRRVASFNEALAERTQITRASALRRAVGAESSPDPDRPPTVPPAETVSRLASLSQLYPTALELASGKGHPSPRRGAAAYRDVSSSPLSSSPLGPLLEPRLTPPLGPA